MQCPVDGATLVMTDRSGVEIDYCPTCRGVWLDRGELDKIIERSSAMSPPPAPQPQRGFAGDHRGQDRDHDYRRKKKKGGVGDLLGEIFDF
ncbi:MAG: zf-TFIIB domain-containing protein [Pseudomonadota bacterium]